MGSDKAEGKENRRRQLVLRKQAKSVEVLIAPAVVESDSTDGGFPIPAWLTPPD
jgi:hypothetical protein